MNKYQVPNICIFFLYMLYSKHMKKIYLLLLTAVSTLIAIIYFADSTHAACGWWTLWFGCPTAWQIEYCQDGKCTLSWGSDATKIAVGATFSQKTISVYVTDIVKYFLGFVSLVGVVYILYAGAQLMLWGGDEEKVKKARQIIIYVIVWILVMWIAYWIVSIIINAIN